MSLLLSYQILIKILGNVVTCRNIAGARLRQSLLKNASKIAEIVVAKWT